MKNIIMVVMSLAAMAAGAVGQNITVSGRAAIAASDAETQVDVQSGGEALMVPSDYDVTVRAQAGGTVWFGVYTDEIVTNAPWASKVTLWLDASHEETLLPETNATGKVSTVSVGGNSTAAIVRWLDRRPEQTTWRGYNNRGKGETSGIFTSVMPYVMSNGCNNLTYISMGEYKSWGRRMPFIKVIDGVEQDGDRGSRPKNPIPSKYVIMILGSQNGGGNTVIANLKRKGGGTAAETGIFDVARATRLDGEEVADPTSTGLNGGWQVLGFNAEDAEILGIGFGDNFNTDGGQNYGEILVFGTMPTVAEIRSVEMYLANKWGITTYSAPKSSGEVRLYGTGAARIDSGAAKLGGSFKGTVTVKAGATLQLTDISSIPTNAAAIEYNATTALQFDPDRADLTVDNSNPPSGSGHNPLSGCDHESLYRLRNLVKNDYYPLLGYTRGPAFVDSVDDGLASWGPQRRWYAYATTWTTNRVHKSSGADANIGNMSRFVDTYSATGNTYDTRTLFMVLDTSAGGGTPFTDTSVYSSGSLYVADRSVDSPIFCVKGNGAFVTNSPCYLNGIAVKSGERGYNGRAELLSCVFTKNMPIKNFGYYAQGADCDLRHGEIILYQFALTDAQRRDTEAYLMNKWLGIAPKGYGDVSGMTVAGAGTVVAADGVHRPQFSADFSGTLNLATASSLAFTADATGAIADAISLANGSIALPSALTVRVEVKNPSELMKSGNRVLVSAQSLTGGTSVTLEMSGIAAGRANQFSVQNVGSQLILQYVPAGTVIMIR